MLRKKKKQRRRPVFRRSDTASWLWSNEEFRIKSGERQQVTHLLFSGGSFSIPVEKHSVLLKKLAKDELHGLPNYVVEMRSPIFRFFQDFDMFHPQERLEPEDLRPIVTHCNYVMRQCFPSMKPEELRMVVCNNDPVWKSKQVFRVNSDKSKSVVEQMDLLKSGYHVIWPELYVDQQMALGIRQLMVDRLREHMKDHWTYQDGEDTIHYDNWEDNLDKTVFERNGLRMLYQRKAEKCEACKIERYKQKRKKGPENKTTQIQCRVCENTGYLDTGRPYAPVAVWNGDEELSENTEMERMMTAELYALRETTICDWGRKKTVSPEIELPEVQMKQNGTVFSSRKRKRIAYRSSDETESHVEIFRFGFKDTKWKILPRNETIFEDMENFINSKIPHGDIPQCLRTIKVAEAKPNTQRLTAILIGENHWCENVGREHGSSNPYYVVRGNAKTKKTTITTHCFSNKYNCGKFKSVARPMPKQLSAKLFSDCVNDGKQYLTIESSVCARQTDGMDHVIRQFEADKEVIDNLKLASSKRTEIVYGGDEPPRKRSKIK